MSKKLPVLEFYSGIGGMVNYIERHKCFFKKSIYIYNCKIFEFNLMKFDFKCINKFQIKF